MISRLSLAAGSIARDRRLFACGRLPDDLLKLVLPARESLDSAPHPQPREAVIVGCLDNREARLSINRFAYAVNKPWVDGAIQELMGIVRVFWPWQGACYECTLTDQDYQIINLRYSCPLLARQDMLQGKVPTTPTSA